MILKIAKWLLLIVAFKLIVALVVAQCYTDPRRDISSRKELCNAFRPNVVFIGTSRTLYGVAPALFDSLNQHKTRSYNFGMFSISPYSCIQLADELLRDNPHVQTLYIELSALDYSTAALPPQDVIPDAIFRANVLADCPGIDLQNKANAFLNGLNTTLFQMVSIAPQILSIKKMLKPESDPIEGNADLQENGHQTVRAALSATNDLISKNKLSTEKMMAAGLSQAPNDFYILQIRRLIERANKLGKRVIFFCPNNITAGEYPMLSQVSPFLPEENLISLSSRMLLDTLFKPENLFDPHHLNRKGAVVYTLFLQKESSRRARATHGVK